MRIPSINFPGLRVGSFVLTLTGFSTTVTTTVLYIKIGPLVVLTVPTATGTSNATTFTATGIPEFLQRKSSSAMSFFAPVYNNGTLQLQRGDMADTDTITFNFSATAGGNGANAFTGSGTKGFLGFSVAYLVSGRLAAV